jgi:hypothetical protein
MYDLKAMMSEILDIMYNIGKIDFWYDKIIRLSYNKNTCEYTILVSNKENHKYKTLHLSEEEVLTYIMKYDF